MKSFILGLLLVFATASSQASTQQGAIREGLRQGSWSIGGGLGIGSSSTSGTIIHATPRAQYFVYDLISVGAVLEYYDSKLYSRIGGGPTATYYFLETTKFVASLNQTLMWASVDPAIENESSLYGITGVALNIFMSRNLALALGYNQQYPLDGGEISGAFSSFQTGIQFFL